MKQYPADFRDRLLRALDAGLARAEAARTFGVPERPMRRWQQRRRETGTVAPQRRLGRRRHIGAEAEAALRAQVRTYDALGCTHGSEGRVHGECRRGGKSLTRERDEAARGVGEGGLWRSAVRARSDVTPAAFKLNR